jgi:hypothetical protein
MLKARDVGDPARAREEQLRGARLVRFLANYGYLAAANATMAKQGYSSRA